jgi:hypothetical protein
MFWREEISCRTFCRSSHLPSNTPLTLTATPLTSAWTMNIDQPLSL